MCLTPDTLYRCISSRQKSHLLRNCLSFSTWVLIHFCVCIKCKWPQLLWHFLNTILCLDFGRIYGHLNIINGISFQRWLKSESELFSEWERKQKKIICDAFSEDLALDYSWYHFHFNDFQKKILTVACT